MEKANKELLAKTKNLSLENAELQQKLRDIEESFSAIKTGNIDALVIAHEQALKVYTETTADKPFRILIEKMHEGAVTLNENGIILYCNSSFAFMVNLPLQKVLGTTIENYIDDQSVKHIEALREEREINSLKEEVTIYAGGGKQITALMAANAMWLDTFFVVSIILTDLTLQNENREKLKHRSEQLEEKNKELEGANKELAFQNEEKEKRAAELDIANNELAFQNTEKEKRAAELVVANKELAFQNEEKDKRAAELGIANKELAFQNEEKDKRAAELAVANKKLAFQNEEKDKRAAELAIANKELAFQNEEKDKRAAELAIANKELAFQNEEKDKRAAELGIANKNLAFQNEEKEKRAAELDIANKELAFQNKEKEKRAAELIITNIELQQLLQLNADKDRFITILAHDLRSPFSSILGFLGLLSENIRNFTIDEIEENVKIVNQSAQNTFNLLEDLILWITSQSGKLPCKPQKLIFTDVCKEVVEILKPIANAKSIALKCLVPEVITVFADIDMLKTILRNLVSNAIKFTSPAGMITINAEKTASNITISVSDNGIGMTPETVNKLFDISQVHTTKGTENEKGTGLGLFLCKDFVEKHGSKLRVESKEGEGSSFYFTLLAGEPDPTS